MNNYHIPLLLLLSSMLSYPFTALVAEESPLVSMAVVRQLALELSDEREVPDELADAIEADLGAIYNAWPGFAELPSGVYWIHNLMVRIDESYDEQEIIDEILSGWPELSFISSQGTHLRYHSFSVDSRYHPVHIAEEVKLLDGVYNASPNGLIGDFSNVLIDAETGEYVFSYGWGDCPSGCTAGLVYRINVTDDGDVQLVTREGRIPNPFAAAVYSPGKHYSSMLKIHLPEGSPLELTGFGFPITTLRWFSGEAHVGIGEPGASLIIDELSPANSGIYTLKATDTVSGDIQWGTPVMLNVMHPEFQWGVQHTFRQTHAESYLYYATSGEHPAYAQYRSTQEYPWLELVEQGWWYELKPRAETYFYDTQIGWFWTRPDLFPYIFVVGEEKWYAYRNIRIQHNRLYYKIDDSEWIWIQKSGM